MPHGSMLTHAGCYCPGMKSYYKFPIHVFVEAKGLPCIDGEKQVNTKGFMIPAVFKALTVRI